MKMLIKMKPYFYMKGRWVHYLDFFLPNEVKVQHTLNQKCNFLDMNQKVVLCIWIRHVVLGSYTFRQLKRVSNKIKHEISKKLVFILNSSSLTYNAVFISGVQYNDCTLLYNTWYSSQIYSLITITYFFFNLHHLFHPPTYVQPPLFW